jgi:hypothetical protein
MISRAARRPYAISAATTIRESSAALGHGLHATLVEEQPRTQLIASCLQELRSAPSRLTARVLPTAPDRSPPLVPGAPPLALDGQRDARLVMLRCVLWSPAGGSCECCPSARTRTCDRPPRLLAHLVGARPWRGRLAELAAPLSGEDDGLAQPEHTMRAAAFTWPPALPPTLGRGGSDAALCDAWPPPCRQSLTLGVPGAVPSIIPTSTAPDRPPLLPPGAPPLALDGQRDARLVMLRCVLWPPAGGSASACGTDAESFQRSHTNALPFFRGALAAPLMATSLNIGVCRFHAAVHYQRHKVYRGNSLLLLGLHSRSMQTSISVRKWSF